MQNVFSSEILPAISGRNPRAALYEGAELIASVLQLLHKWFDLRSLSPPDGMYPVFLSFGQIELFK